MPLVLRATTSQRAISSAMALVLLGIAIVALTIRDWVFPIAAGGAIAAIVFAVRVWALRVEVHPEELVVVNWFGTMRLPWAEVDRFEQDRNGLVVWCSDGGKVRPSAFQNGYWSPAAARESAQAAAARLAEAREQRRGRAS